jgi:hypothetical protein
MPLFFSGIASDRKGTTQSRTACPVLAAPGLPRHGFAVPRNDDKRICSSFFFLITIEQLFN